MALPTPEWKENYDQRKLSTDSEGYVHGTRVIEVNYPSLAGASPAELVEIDTHAVSSVPIVRWDTYPGQPAAVCTTAEVSNNGNTGSWLITYSYTSKLEGRARAAELTSAGLTTPGTGTTSTAPTSPAGGDRGVDAGLRPLELRSIKRVVQEPAEVDAITGSRILNAAGDQFDPPPMKDVTYLGYQVKFWRLPSQLRWSMGSGSTPARPDFMDTVNSTVFSVFGRQHAVRTLRVSDVSTNQIWDKGPSGLMYPINEISVELLHKPGGWKSSLRNQGLRCRPSLSLPLSPILDRNNQPVTEPVPLDSSGMPLPAGGTAIYLDFWLYPELELRDLFT